MVTSRRLIAGILVVAVGAILYLTFPAVSYVFASTPTEFTAENWRGAHKYRREVMAKDFIQRKLFKDIDRDGIIRLLGEPDSKANDRLTYFVEVTAADYMALSIKFDAKGSVLNAYVHQT